MLEKYSIYLAFENFKLWELYDGKYYYNFLKPYIEVRNQRDTTVVILISVSVVIYQANPPCYCLGNAMFTHLTIFFPEPTTDRVALDHLLVQPQDVQQNILWT